MTSTIVKLPVAGTPGEQLLQEMGALRAKDANWKDGRTWSLVYYPGDELYEFLKRAYTMFFSENGLNPGAFPSLRKFETEVVAMTAGMLGAGPEAAGAVTSCGTESIMMALKTYRDKARAERPGVTHPEIVVPETAHPAFYKAAHFLDLKVVRIPVGSDFRADVKATRSAVTENAILIVGSAPSYPQGVIDPVEELAALAREKGVGCHVDACLGGFMLPFIRKLGYPVASFDFSVPGVTSMSADVHKYGFAAKGASTVIFRDRELRKHMFYVFTEWSGGVYAHPTMTGTRPGGSFAAAWAVMKHLGEEGYMEIARRVMQTTGKLLDGVNAVPGLYVLGKPDMSVFSFTSDQFDIYALADAMEARGWHMDRQMRPACLHLMVALTHERIVRRFLDDLKECARVVSEDTSAAPEGAAAMYGMMGTLSDRGMVKDFVIKYMDQLMSVD
ncbi:MAG: aspartate aminotransferase family protein [Firmicutes bacterium]|nr:aspartate aminotransferase family protein [Bacillota bacterium]